MCGVEEGVRIMHRYLVRKRAFAEDDAQAPDPRDASFINAHFIHCFEKEKSQSGYPDWLFGL